MRYNFWARKMYKFDDMAENLYILKIGFEGPTHVWRKLKEKIYYSASPPPGSIKLLTFPFRKIIYYNILN